MKISTQLQATLRITFFAFATLTGIASGGLSTFAQTFTAAGLPQNIPDGLSVTCWSSPGTALTSTIAVSGVPGNVTSATQITVNIKLGHTYQGDVKVTLTPPAGLPIVLISRIGSGLCGSTSDFSASNLLSFNSANSVAVPTSSPVPAGNYVPTTGANGGLPGVMSDLIGSPFNGNWVLSVVDGTSDDLGQLHYFSIAINTCSDPINGGLITESQTICSGSIPSEITSVSLPSGHTGTLEYKWQYSTADPAAIGFNPASWNDIAASNSTSYQPVALTQTTWYRRMARVDCSSDFFESNTSQVVVNPQRIYVTESGAGLMNGLNWDNAFGGSQLREALVTACEEVWVASGTYKPTNGTDRTISFVMKSNVAVFGGFAGTENNLSERNPGVNVTILSGDIGVSNDMSDNSFHVINNDLYPLDHNAVLDGFYIMHGNANGASPYNLGGGMVNTNGGAPEVRNCVFSQNSSDTYGGAVHNSSASANVSFTNCLFESNTSYQGAGIFAQNSTLSVINCTFSLNDASNFSNEGNAIFLVSSNASLKNSIFYQNNGTEITMYVSNLTVEHSIVQGGCPPGTLCTNVLDSDPLFISSTDFNLQPCSPAINAGNNTAIATGIDFDLKGLPRFYNNGTIDIGAYEFQGDKNSNPTDGGSISGTQTICSGATPAEFTSSSLPSGHTGTLEYKWQSTASDPFGAGFDPASWTDLSSSNTPTYQHASISQRTWFRRLSKISCEDTWIASNTLVVDLTPFLITTTPTSVTFDYPCGISNDLTVDENAGNVRFNVPGRGYTLNGGGLQSFPVEIPLANITDITINGGQANDVVHLGNFATQMPNLTVNGGEGNDVINFGGDITFASNASLDLDLQNDHINPGEDQVNLTANTNLIFQGTGSPVIKVSRNMTINTDGSIEVVDGNLVIEVNQQTPATIGNFIGFINIGTLRTTGEGDIIVKGTDGKNASGNYAGIYMYANGLIQSTGTVTGKGRIFIVGKMEDGFSPSGTGIYLTNNATISSAGGEIEVIAITGNGTSSSAAGITLYGNSALIGTGSASISVNANTGNSLTSNNYSIDMRSAGGRITTVDGDISITASAGTGNAPPGFLGNVGLFMNGGSFIETTGNGNINIAATTAKVFNAGSGSQAVRLDTPSVIRSANGNISVVASNLNDESGTGFNHGISLRGNISSSGSGNILLEGTAGIPNDVFANGSQGVQVRNGATVSSAGGNVTIRGTAANTPGNEAITIARVGNGTVSIGSPSKSITFESNSIDIHPSNGTVNAGDGTVVFKGKSADQALDLGGTDAAGILGLSDAELDRVTAGSLIIGGPASGNITVSSDITLTATTNIQLVSNGNVTFTGGGINTGGGTLLLNPGDSPAAVYPDFDGTDITTSALSFGSDLGIVINGNTPGDGTGSSYTQLTISGSLDLTGVDLVVTGTHTLDETESYMIIDNLEAQPIIGTFNGLSEGEIISNLLGSDLSAMISYTGGDGNDVVLNLCSNPTDGGLISNDQTICYNTAPDVFSSVGLPSGFVGLLEYKWQQTTFDPSAVGFNPSSWNDISTSNNTTLQPGTLTQTSWFRRLAKVDCTSDWSSAAASNTIHIVVRDIFSPGNIALTGENICFGGIPTSIVSLIDASGGDQNISYSWRSSADNFNAAIPGATSSTFLPPAGLTETTTYRRYANDSYCNSAPTQSSGEWTVFIEAVPIAGSLIALPTTADTLCEGTAVSALLINNSGGNGTDQTEFRYWTGYGYSEWEVYNGQNLIYPDAKNIEIRSRRLADHCENSNWIQVEWYFEMIPLSGTLNKFPEEAVVCESTQVSATLTDASGGNNTDQTEYRKLINNIWTSWMPYSGQAIETAGSSKIEVQSRRLANYCADAAFISVFWEIESTPVVGTLIPSPAQAVVCQTASVSANLSAGEGGNGIDVTEYRLLDNDEWSAWMPYIPNSLVQLSGYNKIEMRTFRQGQICSNSDANTIVWSVESQAQAGSVIKLPDTQLVCEGGMVSATQTPGLGGNGVDLMAYRIRTGSEWSNWMQYSAGTQLSAAGLAEIEVITQRLADACYESEISHASWLVEPAPFAFAGDNATICANAVLDLSQAAAYKANGVLWETNGDGFFSNPAILNPVYTPGPSDKNNGLVMLTLTANTLGLCQTQSVLQLSINAITTPSVSISSNIAAVCQGTNVSYTATAVNGGSNPSFSWMVNGNHTGIHAAVFNYVPQPGDIVETEMISDALCSAPATANSNQLVVHVYPIELQAKAFPQESGNISVSGNVALGSSIQLTATASQGFTFMNWTDANGLQLSINPTIVLTLDFCLTTVVANFSSNANLSGYLKVFNPVGSSLSTENASFRVQLFKNDVALSDAVTISSSGQFSFSGLDQGNDYKIKLWEHKTDGLLSDTWLWNNWSGVSGLDALIASMMASESPFNNNFPWIQNGNEPYSAFARELADVNKSASVTGNDALTMMYRIVNHESVSTFPNNRHNFIVSGTRSSTAVFPLAPELLFESFGLFEANSAAESVYYEVNPGQLTNGNNTLGIFLSPVGDLNASFIPGLQLKSAPKLQFNQTIEAYAGDIVELPLLVNDNITLGALTLGLNYDTTLIEVLDVYGFDMKRIDKTKGIVSMAWYDANGETFGYDQALAVLKVQLKQNISAAMRYMELLPITEFASTDAKVLEDVQLRTTAINSMAGSSVLSTLSHQVIPNPFNEKTNVILTLPEAGKVKITVFNQFGQLVKTLAETEMPAGLHSVQIHHTELQQSGTYYYNVQFSNGLQTSVSNGKLIFVK